MTPDQFRLALAICAAFITLGYLASVDGQLMVLVVMLGAVVGFLWLCWRLVGWALRTWHR